MQRPSSLHRHRPKMETLENRRQPGSLLSTSALFMLPLGEIANTPAVSISHVSAETKIGQDTPATLETQTTARASAFSTNQIAATAEVNLSARLDATLGLGGPMQRMVRDLDRSVHTLGIIPGSSIKFKDLFETFGEDPPTDILENVQIFPNGALQVLKDDLPAIQVTADLGSGITATGTVNWLSNLRGTYSQTTGKMTAKARFQLVVTSNAPGFDNSNCKVPPVGLNLSSDNPGGAAFLNGEGTIVDNTAIVNAVPDSACGSFIFVDYSDEVNGFLNLPSTTSGDNVLTLRLRMDPALPPP